MKKYRSLFVLVCMVVLGCSAWGAMDLSVPFAPQSMQYTRAAPVAHEYFGSGCALSENFAVIGMLGANSGDGDFMIYRKTVAGGWAPIYTNGTRYGEAMLGGSVAIDGDYVIAGGDNYRAQGVLAEVGIAVVVERNASGVWGNEQVLYSSTEQSFGEFGDAVTLSGSQLAVGAYGEDSGKGIVHIYSNANPWTETQVMYEPDGKADASFGSSVSMDGDLLAIGAPGVAVSGQSRAGAVYIYKRINGVFMYQYRLDGEAVADGYFGGAVSLDGNRMLVGAYGMYNRMGSVYLYEDSGSGFTRVQELFPVAGSANDCYGISVGLDGEAAVIGASEAGANDVGKTYVFQKTGTTWQQTCELAAYELTNSSYFGSAVAIKRDCILASAYHAEPNAVANAGVVFGYRLSQTQKKSGVSASDYFGCAVGVSETHMVAGASGESINGLDNAGAVHLYRRRGRQWVSEQVLQEAVGDAGANHRFGNSLSMAGDRIVVGVLNGTYNLTEQGRLCIYQRSGTTWSNVFVDTGTEAYAHLGAIVALGDSHAASKVSKPGMSYAVVQTYYRNAVGQWIKGGYLRPAAYSGLINFGVSIEICNNMMVVGAHTIDKAFVYRWDEAQSLWLDVTELTLPPYTGIGFGYATAISENRIAVGGYGQSNGKGIVAVYAISGNTVSLETVLVPPDRQDHADFGTALAFANNGKALLISASQKAENGLNNVGGAYVFRLSDEPGVGWTCDAAVSPADDGYLDNFDFFGLTVAACGETLVIGTYADDVAGKTDVGSATIVEAIPRVAPADFDSDGITDIGCYYAPGGNWYVFQSGLAQFWKTQFGYAGTTPFVADFDGDWKADFGCYDVSSGWWFGYDSTDGFWTENTGGGAVVDITGDFDGDGLADRGLFNPSTTTWTFYKTTQGQSSDTFGTVGSVPVTGDFDGDGLCDYGTYAAGAGQWQIRRSRDGDWSTKFGYGGTVPITGDFDGDGVMDFGCYYAPSGAWYIYKSTDGFWVNNFGYSGTVPVTGDFDGDGVEDFGCYYAPSGAWYVYKSTEGFWVNNFGYGGTVPMN